MRIGICVTFLLVLLVASIHAYQDPSCSSDNNCQLETWTSIHFPLKYSDENQHCVLYQLGHYDKTFWLFTKTIAAIGLYVCPNSVIGNTKGSETTEAKNPLHHIKKSSGSLNGLNLFILLKPFISDIPNGMYRKYLGSDITSKGKLLKLGRKQLDLIIQIINESIKVDLHYGDEVIIRMNPKTHEEIIVEHKHLSEFTRYTKHGFPNDVFVKLFKIFKEECTITYSDKSINI